LMVGCQWWSQLIFVDGIQGFALPLQEFSALSDFYISTAGSQWVWKTPYREFGYPWNITDITHQQPCNESFPWQGLNCTSNCISIPCNVMSISLHRRNLNGKLS
jgi:hypothetical protein